MTTILAIKLNDRLNLSQEFQKVLTEYGCIIKTRLGLHDVQNNSCQPNGIIILEMLENSAEKDLIEALKDIKGIKLGKLIL